MSLKRRGGFTLVELLVVIGIIALLISILLPSLTRARQQANLVYCQANLHNIGELIELYASANNGYMPPVGGWFSTPANPGNNQYVSPFSWAEVLTLLVVNTDVGGAVPNSQGGPWPFHPADTLGVFHDVDVPPLGRETIGNSWQMYVDPIHASNTCDYTANIRAFTWMGVPIFSFAGVDGVFTPMLPNLYTKAKASFKRAAEFADVWDGPVFIDPAVNMLGGLLQTGNAAAPQDYPGGGGPVCSAQLDGYGANYSWCYPIPIQTNPAGNFGNNYAGLGPINGQDLANGGFGYGLNGEYELPISLGATGGIPPSAAGGPTLTQLKYENQDQTFGGTNGLLNGYLHDAQFNNMRFRHMGNNTANLLFMDGHVEPRVLGTVTAKDISDNPVK